jgi:hypothetical protein
MIEHQARLPMVAPSPLPALPFTQSQLTRMHAQAQDARKAAERHYGAGSPLADALLQLEYGCMVAANALGEVKRKAGAAA